MGGVMSLFRANNILMSPIKLNSRVRHSCNRRRHAPLSTTILQSYFPIILPKYYPLMRIHTLAFDEQLVDAACSSFALKGTSALAL